MQTSWPPRPWSSWTFQRTTSAPSSSTSHPVSLKCTISLLFSRQAAQQELCAARMHPVLRHRGDACGCALRPSNLSLSRSELSMSFCRCASLQTRATCRTCRPSGTSASLRVSHVLHTRSKLQLPLRAHVRCMAWQLPAGGVLLLVSQRHQQACCPFTCRTFDCKSPAGLAVPRVPSWNESDHHLAKKVGQVASDSSGFGGDRPVCVSLPFAQLALMAMSSLLLSITSCRSLL